jgi:superfamily II DNA or RNA helicase
VITATRPATIAPALSLRPDQSQAIADVYARWRSPGVDNLVMVASTGFGKTRVAARVALDFLNSPNKKGELWLAVHRISLIRGTIETLVAMGIPAGEMTYYWADSSKPICGVRSAQRSARIKIVMLPTLESWAKPGSGNEMMLPDKQIRLLILDECHVTSRSEMGTYLMQRSAKVLGLTATPMLDSPWESLGQDFHAAVLTTPHGKLVARGDLRPFEYHRLGADLFADEALGEEAESEELSKLGKQLLDPTVQSRIITEVEAYAKVYAAANNGVRKTAVFITSQDSAISMAQAWGKVLGAGRVGYILSSGCAVIGSDECDRQTIEDDFGDEQSGLDVILSHSAIAVGFDRPATSVVVLLRKFSNSGTFVQSLGRACRKFYLCSYSLCLDFLNNLQSKSNPQGFAPVEELNYTESEILRVRKKPDIQEVPTKRCPECDTIVFAAARTCKTPDGQGCGYVFKTEEGGEADPVALAQLKLEHIATADRIALCPDKIEDLLVDAVRAKWNQLLRAAILPSDLKRNNPQGVDPYPEFEMWLKNFVARLEEIAPDYRVPELATFKYLGGTIKDIYSMGIADHDRIFKLSRAVGKIQGGVYTAYYGVYTAYWRLAALEFGAEELQRQYEMEDTCNPAAKSVFRAWWVSGERARVKAMNL